MCGYGEESVDVLREISATLNVIKTTLGQTNARLDSIERHHQNLADNLATLITDTNVARLLQHETVCKLHARHSEKKVPAYERVLATTEMLELTLFNLPMRDLLLAQRVSKRFKDVIDTSPTLQRALFFEPTPAFTPMEKGVPAPNPLLVQDWRCSGPAIFSKDGTPFVVKVEGDTHGMWPFQGTNPHIAIHLIDITTPENKSHLHGIATSETDCIPSLDKRCFPICSWRRMLVMQPPCDVRLMNMSMLKFGRVRIVGVAAAKRIVELWQPDCYKEEKAYECVGADHTRGERQFPPLAPL